MKRLIQSEYLQMAEVPASMCFQGRADLEESLSRKLTLHFSLNSSGNERLIKGGSEGQIFGTASRQKLLGQ